MKDNEKKVKFIVPLSFLGGRENIVKVNNCATRLRLEVVDADKVDVKGIEKYYPAVQKISPTEVHIVVGTTANMLAESLERVLASDDSSSNKVLLLIPLLGSRENIVKVNNCATRLRLEVRDADKVNVKEIEKYYPAVQKISPTEVHIVVGTKAFELADELEKLLNMSKQDNDSNYTNRAWNLLPLLGGIDNIIKINNCATRLRLEIKDFNKIKEDEIKKYYPVLQKISNNEVHIVVGTDVNLLANELKKLLKSQSLRTSLLLPLLGGIDNITKINNCATRLRLEVKDINKIKEDEIKKYYPVLQKISNNEVHIVVGTDANLLADELKKFVI